LIGLAFALISIILSIATGNPVYDSFGSIGIGILLIGVSIFIAVKVKGLLIGESSDEETRAGIRIFLEARPEIDRIFNLITIQLGTQIMVAVKAKMTKTESVSQLIDNINKCEAEMKKMNPDILWVFFEPDIRD